MSLTIESLGVQVFTVHEAYSYVWSQKDFRDYIETYVKYTFQQIIALFPNSEFSLN